MKKSIYEFTYEYIFTLALTSFHPVFEQSLRLKRYAA